MQGEGLLLWSKLGVIRITLMGTWPTRCFGPVQSRDESGPRVFLRKFYTAKVADHIVEQVGSLQVQDHIQGSGNTSSAIFAIGTLTVGIARLKFSIELGSTMRECLARF